MDRGSLLMAVELPDGRPHMVSLQEAYALLVRTWPRPAALLLHLYSSLLPDHQRAKLPKHSWLRTGSPCRLSQPHHRSE